MRSKPTICAGLVVSGFALMVGSSWLGSAAADDKQPRNEVNRLTPQSGITSKIFRIKPQSLGVVEERVRSLLPPEEAAVIQPIHPVAVQAGGPAGGGIGGGGGVFGLGGIGGMYGFVNQPAAQAPGGPGLPAGGALGALGIAGAPMIGTVVGGQPNTKWRMVSDDATGSLIFRGTAQDIQLVTDLVTVAKLGADDPLPAVHHIGVFRMKHVKASPLVEKLNQLEMDVRMQAFDDSNLIVVVGPEATRTEAAELIKALDVKVEGR